MAAFSYQTKIGLHHTDAAGILFYSQIFNLAYEAFDAWLEQLGVGVAWIIRESDFLFPYVHAEADFLDGLRVGDETTIELSIERIGVSSLTLNCDFFVGGKKTARVQTVHAAIDKATHQKINLPFALKNAFQAFIDS